MTLRCRAWSCELCQPMRARQLVEQAKAGKPEIFVTITCNPAVGSSPASRARALADAWRVVVRRACRKYTYKNIPYICVFEATKKGEPHLHILCRVKWISQKWLSEQMADLTGSPICYVTQIKSTRKLANYVAKYIGKDPHRFETCKRYWSTRSYALPTTDPEPEASIWWDTWFVSKTSLVGLERTWKGMGYDVVMEGDMLIAMCEDARAPPRLEEQHV